MIEYISVSDLSDEAIHELFDPAEEVVQESLTTLSDEELALLFTEK